MRWRELFCLLIILTLKVFCWQRKTRGKVKIWYDMAQCDLSRQDLFIFFVVVVVVIIIILRTEPKTYELASRTLCGCLFCCAFKIILQDNTFSFRKERRSQACSRRGRSENQRRKWIVKAPKQNNLCEWQNRVSSSSVLWMGAAVLTTMQFIAHLRRCNTSYPCHKAAGAQCGRSNNRWKQFSCVQEYHVERSCYAKASNQRHSRLRLTLYESRTQNSLLVLEMQTLKLWSSYRDKCTKKAPSSRDSI